ncbi:MAG: alpha/beta hydrolase-fold protein [Candidatus Poribacteria bacterium]|nr:alpha/beta hydrolase-fold protein [Candidatus Poribacteria bacterium]
MSKSRCFYITLWLLVSLVRQPGALAQTGELVWWPLIWDALTDNRIGDSGVKSIGVYLPPSYGTSEKHYPVIYVLHGFGGNAKEQADKVTSAMDRMLQNGEIGEMIVVFVDGSNRFDGSQYLSSPTIGDYETYIVRDLVDFIDTTYRTIPHRDSRGITGFSMGGYGSMHLALKYPEVFNVVVAQAGTYDFGANSVRMFTDIAGAMSTLLFELVSDDRAWELFDQLPLAMRSGIAYLAGVAPNPAKPPFYLDLPYELTTFGIRRVDDVWDRIIENDIIHELDRFLQQPLRLNGVKLVHGVQDETAFASQARSLDGALTDQGIDHEYVEHSGGHRFIAEESLQFLSAHLVFESPLTVEVEAPAAMIVGSRGHEIFLTFTANQQINSGEIRVTAPQGWTAPQGVIGVAGYTVVSPLAPDIQTEFPTFSGQSVVVPIQTMPANESIQISYGGGGGASGATAGDTTGFIQAEFRRGSAEPFTTVSYTALNVMTADGSGTASVSPASVTVHSHSNEIAITYTAEGKLDGGSITVHVLPGWSLPQGTRGTAGYTTVTSTGTIGDVTFTQQRIQVNITRLRAGEDITVVYGSGSGSSGATAPDAGIHPFMVSSASSDGTLSLIRQSPLVTVINPDVNHDGVVNIQDLVIVGVNFGKGGSPGAVENPDVNWDGFVNIFDLVHVANHFGTTIGGLPAPENRPVSTLATIRFENPRTSGSRMFLDVVLDTPIPLAGYQLQINADGLLRVDVDTTARDVFRLDAGGQSGRLVAAKLGVERPWLGRVHLATLEFAAAETSVVSLDRAHLVSVEGRSIAARIEPFVLDTPLPQQTQLLPNYPNPFNPETWLPFQLHKDAHVRITIYDAPGREIRRFDLGALAPGYYRTRERAAYWDGRNDMGERVASGTYFYRMAADDFVRVRRMVVLK